MLCKNTSNSYSRKTRPLKIKILAGIFTENSTKTKIKMRELNSTNSPHTHSVPYPTRGMASLLPEETAHLSELLAVHDLQQWALQKRLYDARARLREVEDAPQPREKRRRTLLPPLPEKDIVL